MLLRKIVDWISYNQQTNPSKDINNYFTDECTEKPVTESNEDVHSSSSSAEKTSVLNFCFTSQKNPFDKATCTEESKDLPNCEIQECLPSDTENEEEHFQEVEAETSDCNSYVNQEHFNNDLSPLFQNKTSDFHCHTPLDLKCCRNSFAQTVDKLIDKQRHTSMVTNKHTKNFQILEPNRKNGSFAVFRSKADNSAFFPFKGKPVEDLQPVLYGMLFVFGCNGTVPAHLAGTMSPKFVLQKRTHGNGLKEAFSYVRSLKEPLSISPAKHVISYPVSANTCIDVAFRLDPTRDMFQIGRHDKPPIDFRVDDMKPLGKARNGVSRYACRILIRRDGNHEARIYAAAFDSSQTIFLGEESIPCTYRGKMDGFTTNGILILQPSEDHPGIWREVSVGGNIYPLRQLSKVEVSKRPRLIEESNILRDGTLIDLCGVTLLWRTVEGLKNTPNEEYINRLQSRLHRSVPECQLLSDNFKISPKCVKKAYIFLSCGHVVGLTLPKAPENLHGWSCTVCRTIGQIAELVIGAEPGFYLSRKLPSYAFKPCGHVASLKTVEYWSSVKIPQHRNIMDSLCPFCGVKLNTIKKFVRLIFPVD